MDKLRHIHTMRYFSVIKLKGICTTTWMNLEIIMLNEKDPD